ncbi:hypothetical protein [[Scytonema hofmanni] UTEX B 1581]|uniref:hypothetical protein n=1 Tax=[Scytonema hofmanni] UTEX B 1581 TaxID=379535 RepID=UPI0004B34D48|nr:hypothetical protein [[Scytonema hofmanni] UTEX B 1581]
MSKKLQKLASQLREYRIYVRGGSLPANSLDAVHGVKYNSLIEEIPASETNNLLEENDKQAEFLQFYRHQFQIGLQQALAKVTESRIRQLSRKRSDKAQMFLTALEPCLTLILMLYQLQQLFSHPMILIKPQKLAIKSLMNPSNGKSILIL